MAVWTVGFLQEDTGPCIFQQVVVFGESFPLKVFMKMTGRFQMHSILCNFSFEVVIYAFFVFIYLAKEGHCFDRLVVGILSIQTYKEIFCIQVIIIVTVLILCIIWKVVW